MVLLSLLSPKGDAHGPRAFPHHGFLALTPLTLDGLVRTRLDDDRKPLPAADLFVALRCYEARLGRTGVQHTNLLVDHRVPLWAKPPDQPWADLADGDWPFRLVLPPVPAGHSTAHFQEYRVFWRIEAVLTHIPIPGVGHRKVKTFDLPLIRYDPGVPLPAPPPAWGLVHATKLPAAPALRFLIKTPPFPLGPLDLLPVSLKLVPAYPRVRVAALALAVERRLEFHLPPKRNNEDDAAAPTSTANLLGSDAPGTAPAKAVTFLVASASTNDIPCDDHGTYAKTVTLQIPTPKSSSHWAVGETMQTALVTLRFFLHVKATLTHAAAGSGGASETLALGPARELRLVATNEAQRRLALAKARGRLGHGMPPSPPPTPGKTKGVRRPHTSHGPAVGAVAAGAQRKGGRVLRGWVGETASQPEEGGWRGLESAPAGRGTFGEQEGLEGLGLGLGTGRGLAEEWEAELERVVVQSRRRSVEMLQGAGAGVGVGGERRVRVRRSGEC